MTVRTLGRVRETKLPFLSSSVVGTMLGYFMSTSHKVKHVIKAIIGRNLSLTKKFEEKKICCGTQSNIHPFVRSTMKKNCLFDGGEKNACSTEGKIIVHIR